VRVAALYVHRGGAYYGLPDVDPWDVSRDARRYAGPDPVVAHPPCQRWGRYWYGGPSARPRLNLDLFGPVSHAARREKGDDGGCFAAALEAVERWSGVLEHPEASAAWARFELAAPPRAGSWVRTRVGWACCVEQGHYGHRARKATWLYAVTARPPGLVWGPSSGVRLDEGFHSAAERRAARAAGRSAVERLSKPERAATPPAFRDVLLAIARSARRGDDP